MVEAVGREFDRFSIGQQSDRCIIPVYFTSNPAERASLSELPPTKSV
jgi:hypothetical protein